MLLKNSSPDAHVKRFRDSATQFLPASWPPSEQALIGVLAAMVSSGISLDRVESLGQWQEVDYYNSIVLLHKIFSDCNAIS